MYMKGKISYFNTSHVSINPEQAIKDYKAQLNFNTSHVSINLFSVLFCHGVVDFNTSHVSINQVSHQITMDKEHLFQYISCFY